MPLKSPITGGAWITATLGANVSATGSPYLIPAYRKDSFGIVYLRGSISPTGSVGTVLTLPVGFRPLSGCRFIVSGASSGTSLAVAFFNMMANGNLDFVGGSIVVASFDQIYFSTY